MKKLCEFCSALRPVVYCKADAAHLCLSCDAKVHSANTLFNRHLRTILCDSCKYHPAYVQCLDHKMFMCHDCDRTLHIASQHQKRAISSYTGCPSAKDFAAFWGFELNELDNSAHLDGTLSTSCGSSCDSSAVNLDSCEQFCSQVEGFPAANSPTLAPAPGVGSEVGSSSQQYKISHEGQEHKSTCFILHQILDLKRLQLTEGSSPSLLIRGKEQSDLSSSVHHTSKGFNDNLDQSLQHSEITRFRQRDSLLHDLKVDNLPFPFSQLEHMPPSSTAGLPLDTESFWQCRSPVESCQLWAQNMQDIGVCEELVCHDDFNMPDVDMTFQNFEELFGGDQDPTRALLDDKDVSYSSVLKYISLDKSDNGHARARMEHDASEVSSIFFNKVQNLEGSMDYCPCPIQPSSSTLSFCMSRFSAESSSTDCHESRLSPYIATGETSRNSPHDQEGGRFEARANAMTRYKEKKHSRLLVRKNRYPFRKGTADNVSGKKEEL
ncbi:putative zinc finger protein At1g68190 isoform X1 [Prunus avium]|uniref:Zinc finger protein At1g68190 isoform X1 n=1 Tax=Prunus avium TaxID=42229 RepID=A0A6P5TAW8_PRUAV|nr:putative zinc finger protein At1g68190 isoform X1 [Prunus avium]XP_021824248.1 putative zinc finger protein At1g68190 isoform X1 [Prunus avium]